MGTKLQHGVFTDDGDYISYGKKGIQKIYPVVCRDHIGDYAGQSLAFSRGKIGGFI